MLTTRSMTWEDMKVVKMLHDLHYPDLEFPNFLKSLNPFIIEDETKEIVMAGGVQPIGEAFIVTNKDKSRIKVGKALVISQGACAFTCRQFKLAELVAFTDNQEYVKHLIQHGFEERDQALSMRIPDGQKEASPTNTN